MNVYKPYIEKRNNAITIIALLVWFGVSFLLQVLFMDENERLDAGAIFVMGGGPILLISALHLLFKGTHTRGLVIRSIVGIIFLGTGVGELTDISKSLIWSLVVVGVLAVILAAVFSKALHQRRYS